MYKIDEPLQRHKFLIGVTIQAFLFTADCLDMFSDGSELFSKLLWPCESITNLPSTTYYSLLLI